MVEQAAPSGNFKPAVLTASQLTTALFTTRVTLRCVAPRCCMQGLLDEPNIEDPANECYRDFKRNRPQYDKWV